MTKLLSVGISQLLAVVDYLGEINSNFSPSYASLIHLLVLSLMQASIA